MTSPANKLNRSLNQTPTPSLSKTLELINQLSTDTAQQLKNQKKSANAVTIFFIPVIVFKKYYFLKFYILKGTKGFIYSVLHSFLAFLTLGKLYLLNKKRQH